MSNALGPTNGAVNLLKLDYEYGVTAAANNGNVTNQTITVPTVGANIGFTAVQSYQYDSLNRLKDATENVTPHGGSQSQSWRQAFTFDRFGNRNFDESLTTTLPKDHDPRPLPIKSGHIFYYYRTYDLLTIFLRKALDKDRNGYIIPKYKVVILFFERFEDCILIAQPWPLTFSA